MTSCVLLPDGKALCLNGARMGVYYIQLSNSSFHISLGSLGTGGYGRKTWAIGQSYADDPVLTPVLYNAAAPAGQRWSSDGFSASTVPRMYHSSALLLADGLRISLFFIWIQVNVLHCQVPYSSLAPILTRITRDLRLSIPLNIVLRGFSPRITTRGDPNPRDCFPSFLMVVLFSMLLLTRTISLAISRMSRMRPSLF